MSDPQKQRWYSLPKDRPEAAPFLVLCLLIFVPGFYTIIFALLHIWLWLRHPRSRARYLVAAIPFGLFAFLPIGLAIFYAYLEELLYGIPLENSSIVDVAMKLVGIVTATGIVPLLYRLFSRNSLAYAGESQPENVAPSRGSIADIIFLSAFCAVTFVAMRLIEVEDDAVFDHGLPCDPVALAIGSSISGIVSMRMMSVSKGRAAMGRSVFAALFSFLLIYGLLEATRFSRWALSASDSPFVLLCVGRNRDWGHDLLLLCILSSLIPAYALIMRYCGLVLSRDGRPPSLLLSNSGATKNSAAIRQRIFEVLGALPVAVIVGLVCFAPSKQAGGIPLTYLTNYRNDNGDYEFAALSWQALVVDGAVWILVTFAIVAPGAWFAGPRKRRLRRAVLVGFALIVVNACYVQPLRRPFFVGKEGVLHARRDESFDSALASFLGGIEKDVFGLDDYIQRSHLAFVHLKSANDEMIRQVLSQPRLSRLILEDCQLSMETLKELHGSPLLVYLNIKNCQVPRSAGEIISALPRLQELDVDASALEAMSIAALRSEELVELEVQTNEIGAIRIPDGVGKVNVYVPQDAEGEVEFLGGADLWKANVIRRGS